MSRDSRPLRILIVGMAESVHVARWLNQISGQGWDVHLFPVSENPLHVKLSGVTVHTRTRRRLPELDPSVRRRGIPWPLPRGWVRFAHTLERLPRMSRASRLARVIRALRPDIVHSLEMQHAAYLTLESRRLLGSEPFPPWIYSSWGSDLYFFRSQNGHADRIKAVLSSCDYLITDCERDRLLAAELGFKGTFLGVFPGPGGFDVERMRCFRLPPPVSVRRTIALKGAHDEWVGRALVALEALRRLARELGEHEVVIYSVGPNVRDAAEHVARTTKVRITILPYSDPDEIVALMGRARIAVAVNISDGTPNTMLEAMIMGALPIQSDTVSTREWISDGENGLLVPPEDTDALERALRRALSDDALVERAARLNEQLTATRIAYPLVAPRVVELYRRVAREGNAERIRAGR
jgi:glycosyltransferase involved in cell wall biosynthesis